MPPNCRQLLCATGRIESFDWDFSVELTFEVFGGIERSCVAFESRELRVLFGCQRPMLSQRCRLPGSASKGSTGSTKIFVCKHRLNPKFVDSPFTAHSLPSADCSEKPIDGPVTL